MTDDGFHGYSARNLTQGRCTMLYNPEHWDSEPNVELPFVIQVLAPLSGHGAGELPSLEERESYHQVGTNLSVLFNKSKPKLQFEVDNKLTGKGKMMVELAFESLDDFSPEKVAQKLEPLRKILTARTRIAQLKLYGLQKGGKLYNEILKDPFIAGLIEGARKRS